MRIIRKAHLQEGGWRNGMGVSWDIASDAEDFGWRLAIARIDSDVPFSNYPYTDRYFTLIEGQGLDLDFEGRDTLAVDALYVPHFYACDIPTFCRLRLGPCRALNLFTKRSRWTAEVAVVTGDVRIAHDGPVLFFALDGPVAVDGDKLEPGDTGLLDGGESHAAGVSRFYVAKLSPVIGGGDVSG